MESELVPESVYQKLFPDDNDLEEAAMCTQKCKKISRWGIPQERILILSTHFVYLLHNNSLRKRVSISKLKYIVKSTTNHEILLYFTDESDFRL